MAKIGISSAAANTIRSAIRRGRRARLADSELFEECGSGKLNSVLAGRGHYANGGCGRKAKGALEDQIVLMIITEELPRWRCRNQRSLDQLNTLQQIQRRAAQQACNLITREAAGVVFHADGALFFVERDAADAVYLANAVE